ncbi:hypothetical protein QTP86_016823 [Hemibagrus guttatus]|nr:hypothetical protein QTP86_016823 [Hemibagrus guttatus]
MTVSQDVYGVKVILYRAEAGFTALKHDCPIVVDIYSQKGAVTALLLYDNLPAITYSSLFMVSIVGTESPVPRLSVVSVGQEICDGHPCELHCRPVDEGFSERMLDAVTDGTPCFSNSSRSICINGVCKLLFQETNPGVRYEFIMKKNSSVESDLLEPRYLWKYGAWTDCSATCGQGSSHHLRGLYLTTIISDSIIRDKMSVRIMRSHQDCSLTCGGGVKSRSIKCVTEPQTRCDPVTRPRSTTFCNLQSCSRTRPNPSTPTPAHDPDDLTSAPTPSPYTPTVSTSHTPTPSVLHEDDQDFILVNNSSAEDHTHGGEGEDEEGSTDLRQPPDRSPYTPGYDYITGDDREDVFTVHTPCSTSCGLGAVWRSVVCSSGQDSDCSSTARPEPAQHCNLQPCAVWRKCVEGCVSGMKYKDVQCVDSQSGRVLRPFHCTDQPSPSTVQWKHTRWGQCSQSCGGGVMERSVFCPEPERCDVSLRPESSTPCNLQPCVWWSTEPWQQCSKSCGGGIQKRVIRCVSEGSGEEVKSSLCLKDDKPESLRSCGEEECKAERVCKRDSMSTRFCSTLKLLGRCVLSSVRKQCCLTCVM